MRVPVSRCLVPALLLAGLACGGSGGETTPAPTEEPWTLDAGEASTPTEAASPIDATDGSSSCPKGQLLCDDKTPLTCTDTGAIRRGAPCPYACRGGLCAGECAAGQRDCDGKQPLICAGSSWVRGGLCANLCSRGNCVDSCSPGSTECHGRLVVRCTEDGAALDTIDVCPYVCANGQCQGECIPGALRCAEDGKVPMRCGADGLWAAGEACDGACQEGVCTVGCDPGAVQCSGRTPLLCNQQREWQPKASCEFACAKGTCAGSCNPGGRVCGDDGRTLRVCSEEGVLVDGATCHHGCDAGRCAPAPVLQDAGRDGQADGGQTGIPDGGGPQDTGTDSTISDGGSGPVDAGLPDATQSDSSPGQDAGDGGIKQDGGALDADAGIPLPPLVCAPVSPSVRRKVGPTVTALGHKAEIIAVDDTHTYVIFANQDPAPSLKLKAVVVNPLDGSDTGVSTQTSMGVQGNPTEIVSLGGQRGALIRGLEGIQSSMYFLPVGPTPGTPVAITPAVYRMTETPMSSIGAAPFGTGSYFYVVTHFDAATNTSHFAGGTYPGGSGSPTPLLSPLVVPGGTVDGRYVVGKGGVLELVPNTYTVIEAGASDRYASLNSVPKAATFATNEVTSRSLTGLYHVHSDPAASSSSVPSLFFERASAGLEQATLRAVRLDATNIGTVTAADMRAIVTVAAAKDQPGRNGTRAAYDVRWNHSGGASEFILAFPNSGGLGIIVGDENGTLLARHAGPGDVPGADPTLAIGGASIGVSAALAPDGPNGARRYQVLWQILDEAGTSASMILDVFECGPR